MIRPFEPGDLAALLDVWRRSSDGAHPFLEAGFQDEQARVVAEDYLPNTETWVCLDDAGQARLVGFLSLMGDEVGGLFVDPDDQRRGYGRRLLDHVRAGRGSLEVEVFAANAGGLRFYERYGFRLVRRGVHGPTGQPIHRLALH